MEGSHGVRCAEAVSWLQHTTLMDIFTTASNDVGQVTARKGRVGQGRVQKIIVGKGREVQGREGTVNVRKGKVG